MFKILNTLKDTYITNKVIGGIRCVNSNVGKASTLDLYKLYGENEINNEYLVEDTKLLIQFDLDPLYDLLNLNKIDINGSSFNVTMKLFDVYGGQPTPENFTININPLSQSFDEGLGKDIVRYADLDSSNYITASHSNNVWLLSGANLSGTVPAQCDYYTTLVSNNDLTVTQTFVVGTEDLSVDVTQLISATLTNQIPNNGFRISFSDSIQNDLRTYFVKRFASRQAYDHSKHPQLIVKYDDSILDDSGNLELDSNNNVFLYNYNHNILENLNSTGSNSIKLKLITPISGSNYELIFTGSQVAYDSNLITGIYSASVYVSSSNSNVQLKLQQTGSIDFTPVWIYNNDSLIHSGTKLTFYQKQKLNYRKSLNNYTVSVSGIKNTHSNDEIVRVRVNIFDYTSPIITFVKKPLILNGLVIKHVYYQVRDYESNQIIIPFDTIKNSTRLSSDYQGMWFDLDTSNLILGHTYVIDILISNGDDKYKYINVSQLFKLSDS